MALKDDTVQLKDLSPQILFAIQEAREILTSYGVKLVITSANDGVHGVTSLHYAGQAVDIRTRDLPTGKPREVAEKIKAALNVDFDVLFEGDHIHIEYQPRRR